MRGRSKRKYHGNFNFIVGLRLNVDGEAVCEWSESHGNQRSTTNFRGEEKHLELVTYLMGSKDSEAAEVRAGIYTYKFECLLPENVPYSVEGKHGHIRYKVAANLDIPWAFDLQEEKPFSVVRNEVLNSEILRSPCEFEEIKVFCCWFCKSQPLVLKVRLPKTGFGLGEKVPIFVEMVNNSSTNVSRTNFSLKRIEQFNSHSPTVKEKIVKETVVEKSSEGVKAGQTAKLEEFLEIPQVLTTSNDSHCKVFQIKYEIKFSADTEGLLNVAPEIQMPITIGTVGVSPN